MGIYKGHSNKYWEIFLKKRKKNSGKNFNIIKICILGEEEDHISSVSVTIKQ